MHKSLAALSVLSVLVISGLAQPDPAQKESLLIGPGDLVHIHVFDTPEMEQSVRVTDAGTIPLAFLGSVKLAGQTPAAAATSIRAAFAAAESAVSALAVAAVLSAVALPLPL